MKLISPASGKRQGLDNDFDELYSSISFKKPKEISHIKILKEIGVKWVDRRCYRTLDRALRALIAGDI